MKFRSRKIVKAKRPLAFEIVQCDVDAAEPKSKNHCVVVQALCAQLGEIHQQVEAIHVGTRITKIFTANRVTKYETPSVLGDALPAYDRLGVWDLPLGWYVLGPYPQSTGPRHDATNPKRPSGRFVSRSAPTRFVTI